MIISPPLCCGSRRRRRALASFGLSRNSTWCLSFLLLVVTGFSIAGCAGSGFTGFLAPSVRPYGEIREASVSVDPSRPITLRARDGRVRVSTHEENLLTVFAEAVVYAPDEDGARELFDRITIDVTEEMETILVRVHGELEENAPVEVHIHLAVPRGSSLSVQARNGSIDIEGPLSSTLVSSDSGRVQVSGVQGNLVVAHREGDLDLRRIGGRLLKAYTYRGNAILRSVKVDRVEVTTGSGDLELQQIEAGLVSARTQEGSMRLEEIVGQIDVESTRGDLFVAGLRAPRYTLHAIQGNIAVANARGQATVKSPQGEIHLSRVSGAPMTFESGVGTVLLTGGDGALAGTSKAGGVIVQSFRGSVDLDARSGALSVQGELGQVRARTGSGSVTAVSTRAPDGGVVDWHLATDFGPVRALVPPAEEFEIDLTTKLGRVRVELPGSNVFETRETSFVGTVGQGHGRVIARSGGGLVSVGECPGGDLNPHSQ